MSHHRVEVDGAVYELDPQPVRTALSEGPPMLWGFEVRVIRNGELVGIKTCFVGRVSVQFRDAAALEGGIDVLAPVLHQLAFEKIEAQLRAGELEDEIIFA